MPYLNTVQFRKIKYGKCSESLNTFLIQFSNKVLVIRTETHKKIVNLSNSADPDQTASSEAV